MDPQRYIFRRFIYLYLIQFPPHTGNPVWRLDWSNRFYVTLPHESLTITVRFAPVLGKCSRAVKQCLNTLLPLVFALGMSKNVAAASNREMGNSSSLITIVHTALAVRTIPRSLFCACWTRFPPSPGTFARKAKVHRRSLRDLSKR